MMLETATEVFVNLLQSCMFIGFLYLFFDKPENKLLNIASLCCAGLMLFALFNFFTFTTVYVNFVDILTYILVMEIYTILFLKGNIWLKLIMPIISMLINTIISFSFGYSVSFATGESFEFLISQSSVYRYFCLAIVNLTNILVLWLILKVVKKKISLTKWTDIFAFVVIPIIAMIIIYCTFYILYKTEFQSDIVFYLAIICVGMIAVAVTVLYMMISIGKNEEVKTKLLLSEQREHLYKENVLQTNIQIEKIAKIKHDMKNNLMCFEKLLANNKIEEAESLCNDVLSNLSVVYTPISTSNPLLNAIVNVELEKAVTNKIEFEINIMDDLKSFSNTSDIVSIIGNLCDNAIEYLCTIPEEMRKMSLDISVHNKYNIISCKNRIIKSVLEENPYLHSSKQDSIFHGKGTEILKNISQKYDGDTRIHEKDNYFCCNVILKMPSLPEKEQTLPYLTK